MSILPAEPGYELIDDERCRSFQSHLEIVGRKWNGAILLAAMRGATRFSEYRAMVAGISDRLLSVRLKELEAEGLITRVVVPTTPVTVRYEPTRRGRGLMGALTAFQEWAADDERRQAGRLRSVSN